MLKVSPIGEQVTAHLREGLKQGRWTGLMPGRDRLVRELGVNGGTIDRALAQLEHEGVLESRGAGKRRRIVSEKIATPAMPVNMILYDHGDEATACVSAIRYRVKDLGYHFDHAPQTLMELKQDPLRIAKMVKALPGRAWIVNAGSRAVLEWFSEAPDPAFALFGNMHDLSIAGSGPDYLIGLKQAIERLSSLGHQRIVLLARAERRQGELGIFEQAFLDNLEQCGIAVGGYNLPDWEDSPNGLRQCLDELFRLTPPTAILIQDTLLLAAVQNYLIHQAAGSPDRVVLICLDHHPSLQWCQPAVPHFRWDHQPVLRRVERWIRNVARGRKDIGKKRYPAELVGTKGIGG